MNTAQRAILVGAGVVMLAMILFPPWSVFGQMGAKVFLGYAFIAESPSSSGSPDVSLLFLQELGIIFIAAVFYFAAGGKKKKAGE